MSTVEKRRLKSASQEAKRYSLGFNSLDQNVSEPVYLVNCRAMVKLFCSPVSVVVWMGR